MQTAWAALSCIVLYKYYNNRLNYHIMRRPCSVSATCNIDGSTKGLFTWMQLNWIALNYFCTRWDFFFSGMHHYKCIAPYVDISLHRGQFWARSTASFSVMLQALRSYWTVWYEDTLVVSSSSLVGEPLESFWHQHHHPCVQYAQMQKDAMTGLSLWG